MTSTLAAIARKTTPMLTDVAAIAAPVAIGAAVSVALSAAAPEVVLVAGVAGVIVLGALAVHDMQQVSA